MNTGALQALLVCASFLEMSSRPQWLSLLLQWSLLLSLITTSWRWLSKATKGILRVLSPHTSIYLPYNRWNNFVKHKCIQWDLITPLQQAQFHIYLLYALVFCLRFPLKNRVSCLRKKSLKALAQAINKCSLNGCDKNTKEKLNHPNKHKSNSCLWEEQKKTQAPPRDHKLNKSIYVTPCSPNGRLF